MDLDLALASAELQVLLPGFRLLVVHGARGKAHLPGLPTERGGTLQRAQDKVVRPKLHWATLVPELEPRRLQRELVLVVVGIPVLLCVHGFLRFNAKSKEAASFHSGSRGERVAYSSEAPGVSGAVVVRCSRSPRRVS